MPQKRKIIVDTGFIVALFNEQDPYHEAALDLEAQLGDDYQFVSTIFVFQEIYWLLRKRGLNKVLEFMACLKEQLIVFPNLPDQWLEQATILLNTYSDKRIDLADISLIILADLMDLEDIASVDVKDFSFLKWKAGKRHFNNHMKPFLK